MIFDSIANAHLYDGLGEGIRQALAFFAAYDPSGHEATPLTIGDDMLVNRAAYTTGATCNPQMEGHRKYVDVMYMAEGEEALFYLPIGEAADLGDYNPAIEASLCPLHPEASRFRFQAGTFAIFFPEDLHCPGQLWDQSSCVKKLIAKVPINN